MAFCSKCGAEIPEGSAFCPACGAPVAGDANAANNAGQAQNSFANSIKNINNTPDYTSEIDPADAQQNKIYGVLAYLGILVLIPIFAAPKNSRYARFHSNQGLVLLIFSVGYTIISSILRGIIKVREDFWGYVYSYTPEWVNVILGLLSIPFIVLAIIGIVNAVQGKCKELPVIGKIKILK